MAMEALEPFLHFSAFEFEWERPWVAVALSPPNAYSYAKGLLGQRLDRRPGILETLTAELMLPFGHRAPMEA
jgi:hypothetical protein